MKEPKFKVGDKVRTKDTKVVATLLKLDLEGMPFAGDYLWETDNKAIGPYKWESNFELAPQYKTKLAKLL